MHPVNISFDLDWIAIDMTDQSIDIRSKEHDSFDGTWQPFVAYQACPMLWETLNWNQYWQRFCTNSCENADLISAVENEMFFPRGSFTSKLAT